MNQKLNIGDRSIKLLEENMGVNLLDLGFDCGFLDVTQKHNKIN